MGSPSSSKIELVGFRVREAKLEELSPPSPPAKKGEAMMYLGRHVEINPKDNKHGRLFLRTELTISILKFVLVSEARFKNPGGFTPEGINSDKTLNSLINMAWPKHLEVVKFLAEKAGYQVEGLPEKIERLEGAPEDAES